MPSARPRTARDFGPTLLRRQAEMNDIDTRGRGSTGNVIAALCSFFAPGLGQLVQGRYFAAALFFLGSLLLWCVCLGWAVHLWSIIDAAVWRPQA